MACGFYRFLDAVRFRDALRVIYRVEVAGADRIPAEGPALLVANHDSMADPFLLGVATPRRIRYMAKAELWSNPLLARAMDGLGTFPVDRGTGGASALGRGAELLAEGELLGMFPEGTSRAFRRRPYLRGAARLAIAAGAPVVPICMLGVEHVLPSPKRWYPGLPQVTILIASPIPVERGKPTVAAARVLTRQIQEAILELRRPYGPPKRHWID